MSESREPLPEIVPRPRRSSRLLAPLWIGLLAVFLNLFRLDTVGINGYGSIYYAAAAQSMQTSWWHFFFLAFDPTGTIALDKPPLAHWIQALSAKLLGFRGWSLLLPQAVAGALSVFLVYYLVRRAHGQGIAIASALLLTLTPISVAANRSNHAEPLLVLTMVLAAWATTRAVETRSLRWLLAAGALVGIGFNIKMLQILLVAPGLGLFYLLAADLTWRKRLAHLGLASIVALGVALPWALAVELTPPDTRPFVDGSVKNSVIDLTMGYNGLARLWGEDWGYYIGTPGPLRLLGAKVGGQISWWLPLTIIGVTAFVWRWAKRGLSKDRRNSFVLWAGWTAPQLVYFSVSTFYHKYYLAILAPGLAALAAIALGELWEHWRSGGGGRVWLSCAVAATGIGQVVLVAPHSAQAVWLIPLILALAAVGATLLWLRPGRSSTLFRLQPQVMARIGLGAWAGALIIAPVTWVAISLVDCPYSNAAATMPAAGPRDDCRGGEPRPWLDPELVAFLEENRLGAAYLGATYDLGISSLAILATGEPFLTLGGFRGNMPIMSVDEFAHLVAEGKVRYFLSLSDQAEYPIQEPIRRWVSEHCPRDPISLGGVLVSGPCLVGE